MKKYFLLITLLVVGLFWPKTAQASSFHWPDRIKSFFQNPLPANLKFCVDYEGNFYVAGDIFKSKTCNKKDKEIVLNATATSSGGIGAQGPQGEPGPKGDKGDTGLQGIQGIQGEKGDKGDAGANGLSGWENVSTTSASTTEQLKTVTVSCPGNKKVITGGFVVNSSTVTFYTVSNYPSADNAWTASVHRSSTATPWDLTVHATCAVVI